MSHYNRRDFLSTLGLGCASVGATTLLSGITNMGLLNAAASANAPVYTQNGYKALVCILLAGGNDSYNMLIPRGASEYTEYADVRTNLKIPQEQLLPVNPLNPDGRLYGLHPNMPNIQSMFNTGKLAFIANVGALVAPTTLTTFNGAQNLPLGLFSHSDQEKHWQTSVPQDRNALGWGGRLADILHTNNANQNISMNISLNGINIFQRGDIIQSYAIEPRNSGSVAITGSSNNGFYQTLKRQTLDNLLDINYQNILEKAYANSVTGSKESSLEFSTAIDNGVSFTTVFGEDNLSQRLNMVAKTIAARDFLNVSNQTFFVQLGGFDTHDNFMLEHGELMATLDTALQSFYDTLVELGVENDVTTFTISDFARKLVSNGNGSDHAWGGHALVMGGAVAGQKIYGQYPNLYLGNSLDTGDGRLIPTTSCDEYFAELAMWFGASPSDLNQILPNIGNFWTPSAGSQPIGFMG